jgi:hypothetical protein
MQRVRVILIAGAILLAFALTVHGQNTDTPDESFTPVSHDTFNRVLDILFPRHETAKNYLLVLRFATSRHAESQIVIKGGGDKPEVLEYSTFGESIYNTLNQYIIRGGKEGPVERAKLVQVRRRVIKVPRRLAKQWENGFLASFAELPKSFRAQIAQIDRNRSLTISLDGTLYEFWLEEGMSKTSFRVWDEEVSDTLPSGRLGVVRWMNEVRREVAKLK